MTGLWPAGWANIEKRAPAAPLILTAALPSALQTAADALRASLQPEAARHAPAHLTLFRHLPGPRADELLRDIRSVVAQMEGPRVTLQPPRRWDGLWASPVDSPELDDARAELAERWHGLLAPGDIAPPRLHISLGKSADPPPALAAATFRVPGLLLWQYGEACWSALVACRFRG
jgi:hypothetical protein